MFFHDPLLDLKKKFKCMGDVLDSVTPITVAVGHIEVPSFGRFYNLAQILI